LSAECPAELPTELPTYRRTRRYLGTSPLEIRLAQLPRCSEHSTY